MEVQMVHCSPRWLLAVAALASSACSAQGLASAELDWPRFQTRLSLGAASQPGAAMPATSVWSREPTSRVHSASLYGDYYFNLPYLTAQTGLGGFRATSGLLYGDAVRGIGRSVIPADARNNLSLGRQLSPSLDSSSDDSDDGSTAPYVGIGYTRLSVSGSWGFSADLGLVTQNPGGAWRLGRALLGSQYLDDAVRNLRLAPLVHVDVRYSF
jgi:hypothetical protein